MDFPTIVSIIEFTREGGVKMKATVKTYVRSDKSCDWQLSKRKEIDSNKISVEDLVWLEFTKIKDDEYHISDGNRRLIVVRVH